MWSMKEAPNVLIVFKKVMEFNPKTETLINTALTYIDSTLGGNAKRLIKVLGLEPAVPVEGKTYEFVEVTQLSYGTAMLIKNGKVFMFASKIETDPKIKERLEAFLIS